MTRADTNVQFRDDPENERVWASVSGPLDLGEAEVKRASFDVRSEDNDFLERYAAYRNALATAQGKKLRQQWSKKSMGESFIAVQCDAARHQLGDMFKAVGPFPELTGDAAKDAAAMAKYAKAVIAWDEKHNK
jgi:hypothetical protein